MTRKLQNWIRLPLCRPANCVMVIDSPRAHPPQRQEQKTATPPPPPQNAATASRNRSGDDRGGEEYSHNDPATTSAAAMISAMTHARADKPIAVDYCESRYGTPPAGRGYPASKSNNGYEVPCMHVPGNNGRNVSSNLITCIGSRSSKCSR